MFVTQDTINEIADEMQISFEVGPLNSRSSIREIARHATEHLADRGLPTRGSLAFVIAKVALMTWHETIHQTKVAIANMDA